MQKPETTNLDLSSVCICVCVHSVMSSSLRPLDCSPPGSSVRRILQARILEWVVIYCRGDLSRWGYKSEILEFIMKESVTFIRRHSLFLRRICRPSPVLLDSWSPPGRHSSVGSSASLTEVLTFREVPLGRCACSVLQRVLLFLPAV